MTSSFETRPFGALLRMRKKKNHLILRSERSERLEG
jgi:hypothetical protein